ncbi:MAG TPA: DNA internalization-related competence protein ComEC/Rec2, partial [Nitrospirota bacterium]
GHGFLYFPHSLGIPVLLVLLTAAACVRANKLTSGLFLLTALPCLIGIAAYLYSAAWLPADHYARLITTDRDTHAVTGRIASPLDRDPDRTGFVLDLRDIDGAPVSGRIRATVYEPASAIGYGDVIRFKGKLYKPRGLSNPGGFDYPAFLARSGIFLNASVKSADAIEVLSSGSGVFRSIQDLRERIRQAFLASTDGPGSAVLQAMVLGEEGGLSDELRDRFMAAGVTHIISISGSHLGMLAVLCFGLFRGMMLLLPERQYHRLTLYADPKKIAVLITLPLLVFYTLLAGGQVATVRSLIMIAAGLLALIADREHAIPHSLALAAFIILLANPQAIFDISFQLSFVSVLVIGYVVTLWNDLPFKGETLLRKTANSAALLLIISFAAGLATGPLAAYYFNQISFAGIFANMVVVPVAGMIVVPLGLASAIGSLFTLHLPLAAVNQFAADAFVRLVTFFSRMPFAEFHPPAPSIPWLLFFGLFLVSLLAVVRARLLAWLKPLETTRRAPRSAVIGMALSGIFLVALTTLTFLPVRYSAVSFPDVGQGDCALITFASGKTVLIDGGGTRDNRFDIGRRVLAPYLWNRGIRKLDLVILSHPHPDHMNGLVSIVKKISVAEVWESGQDGDLPGHEEFRQALAEKNIPVRIVSADDPPYQLGNAELKVLHPGRDFTVHDRKAYAEENNRSLVVRISAEGKVFLFTGDIGDAAEQALARAGEDLKADLLKVPHHGSKTSSSEAFVTATRPEVAVVTVGNGNLYRHPSDEVIARYQGIGAGILRTDHDGAVTIRIRRGRLELTRWNDLLMRRIEIRDHGAWRDRERENAQRLLIRTMAF